MAMLGGSGGGDEEEEEGAVKERLQRGAEGMKEQLAAELKSVQAEFETKFKVLQQEHEAWQERITSKAAMQGPAQVCLQRNHWETNGANLFCELCLSGASDRGARRG